MLEGYRGRRYPSERPFGIWASAVRSERYGGERVVTSDIGATRGASGYSVDERPEYQALRERVRNRDVAAITLRDMGRLGRDFDERILFIIDLRKAGIELHTVERGQRDLDDPYSVAVEGIQATSDDAAKRAEIERAKGGS